MKPHYFYGVDEYGNVHAFKSKGYNRYMLVHDTNDFDTYTLVRYK